MEKNYESLIFDYKKRQEMRNHPVFINIKEIWEKGLYDSPQKVGCLNYLLKQVHENKIENNPNAIVKLNEWIRFYFDSGKKRLNEPDTYQSKQYFGRTLEELYSLSLELQKDINSRGYNINEQAALNIVYIKIIDDTFNEYVRCFNTIFKLQNAYPEFTFVLTKPLESIEYGIDVLVKSGNSIISAIKVCRRPMIKIKEENEKSFKQKHDVFKMIYNVDTIFIYSSINGCIEGNLPTF